MWQINSGKTYYFSKPSKKSSKSTKYNKSNSTRKQRRRRRKRQYNTPRKFVHYITHPNKKKKRMLIKAENTMGSVLAGLAGGRQGYVLWNSKDAFIHQDHRSYRGKWLNPIKKHFHTDQIDMTDFLDMFNAPTEPYTIG